MKYYTKYAVFALSVSAVVPAALVQLGLNYWLMLVLAVYLSRKLFPHARDAALHDMSVDEFGARFVSYDPITNVVQVTGGCR